MRKRTKITSLLALILANALMTIGPHSGPYYYYSSRDRLKRVKIRILKVEFESNGGSAEFVRFSTKIRVRTARRKAFCARAESA
jgi:hypothetical protein